MTCIVVGLDGREPSTKAGEVAVELAEALGLPLHIVTAHQKGGAFDVAGEGSDAWHIDNGDEAFNIASAAELAYRARGVTVTSSSPQGKPADVLMAEAERLDARLIVVGNFRMQGAGRILGSVANSVAHHAPCDVHIVKTR